MLGVRFSHLFLPEFAQVAMQFVCDSGPSCFNPILKESTISPLLKIDKKCTVEYVGKRNATYFYNNCFFFKFLLFKPVPGPI